MPENFRPIRARVNVDLREAILQQSATSEEGEKAILGLQGRIDTALYEMYSAYGATPAAGDYITFNNSDDEVYVIGMRDIRVPGKSGSIEVTVSVGKLDLSDE